MYQPAPLPSTSSSATTADPTFWSPPPSAAAPPHSLQPTSILQRPPQPPPQPLPATPVSASAADFASGDYSQIFEWVGQLLNGPEGRDKALSELSKKREQYDDLALILWHSFGTAPVLV